MDLSDKRELDGTAAPASNEQLRAVEALVAHYERLLSAEQETVRDWERIFEAIEDPICVVTADYRLIRANAAYRRVFGAEPVGDSRHYCFSEHGDDENVTGPCAECPLPETVRTRCAGFTQQVWWTPGVSGGAAEARSYQRWIYPIINANGTVDRVVEVLKDVTEQEQMRRSLTGAEALREADRLKAELLGTVSHELRSPLTAIKGYAATLLRHEHRLPREERHEFLEAIGEASDRLEVIINRLLEMSQLETGSIVPHFAPMDIAQVAREAIAAANMRANEREPNKYVFNLHLLSSSDTDTTRHAARVISPVIEADTRLLRDALDNLLENAVKYSPEGGSIEVTIEQRSGEVTFGIPRVSGRPEEPRATEQAVEKRSSEVLEIVVRDTGVGIPAEHLGRVFDRFHRVDTRLTREVDGLGLGLAICKRIAELHGGTIWAESMPGEGSAFHVLVPLAASPTAHETVVPVV